MTQANYYNCCYDTNYHYLTAAKKELYMCHFKSFKIEDQQSEIPMTKIKNKIRIISFFSNQKLCHKDNLSDFTLQFHMTSRPSTPVVQNLLVLPDPSTSNLEI